jgi:dihydroxyacetone kinase-like protein
MQNPDERRDPNTSGSVYANTPAGIDLTGRGAVGRPVAVARIFEVIGSAMQRERGRLDSLESHGGPGTYGARLARAMSEAAAAVRRAGTGDVGHDLELAAEAIETVAGGQSGRYYRQGLWGAARDFAGRRDGLTLADLPVLLKDLLEGVQENNPARPGQSTMLDVLIPAVTAYTTCQQQGLSEAQCIQSALGAAAMGRKKTAKMPPLLNVKGRAGREDPGAAGMELFLGGLMRALLGGGPVEQNAPPLAVNPGALLGGQGGPSFNILPTGFLTGGEGGGVSVADLLSSVEAVGQEAPDGPQQTDYVK